MDWVKIAKEAQLKELALKQQQDEERNTRLQDILDAEANWRDRVQKRVQAVTNEGFPVIARRKNDTRLELTYRGTVQLEFAAHQTFVVIFRDVRRPTVILLARPVTVSHHRMVKVRELNEHNIEEILKFVVLGMEKYCQIATYSRVERNLQAIVEFSNVDEHG